MKLDKSRTEEVKKREYEKHDTCVRRKKECTDNDSGMRKKMV